MNKLRNKSIDNKKTKNNSLKKLNRTSLSNDTHDSKKREKSFDSKKPQKKSEAINKTFSTAF